LVNMLECFESVTVKKINVKTLSYQRLSSQSYCETLSRDTILVYIDHIL
jgi:hypothetical protein